MPADVVKLDDRRLRKTGAAQLARELMGLPAKRRLELILERPDAQSVTRALEANDFFHTIQEIGPDDSLSLLALASIEQVNHLFDIEWWRRDSLEPAKALAWLERLTGAGEEKLFEWISKADYELLVTLFKQWISVDTAPEDIDMIEAAESLPPMSLDNFYFWESRYPQFDDLITQMLTIIFETNYVFFKELLNSVIYAPAPEVEESALRFHRARLEDHGIPDFYDALEIYRVIGAGEFTEKIVFAQGEAAPAAPTFALALLPPQDLFAKTLARLEDPDLVETLQAETAALANKVIIADQIAPDDARALRRAVDKTLAYINLGLELRSGANLEKASQIVGNNFLEHLFRLAQAEVARVRGRLRKTVAGGIKHLDGEWHEGAEELLATTPKIFRSGRTSYDFFRTPSDLARASHFVDVIIAAGDLYKRLTGNTREPGTASGEDVTVGMVVLTAAANLLLSGKWSAQPLRQPSWPEIFSSVHPRTIRGAVTKGIEGTVSEAKRRSLVLTYLDPILRDYELEMGAFSLKGPPDPQLVRFFVFTEE
ncbi:MAG: DUF6178 family protein [Syntrophobacteraceae bacterium]|nr:DUF6178 family protein [Syntrophobacteraceae bacterium]